MKFKLIPTDIARTSMPQTLHFPRGEKLQGEKVDNIVVQGYDRNDPQRAIPRESNQLCTILYVERKNLVLTVF
jgi:hypothetical protein